MRIGFIGAGNMASALARGLGEPALVSDVDGHKAGVLAGAIGGQAVESNVQVAQGSDLVFLCHKPKQLDEVAAELRDHAKVVVSILGGVPLATVEAAYPDRPVYRAIPNIPVELKQGTVVYVAGRHVTDDLNMELYKLLQRLGSTHKLWNEELMDVSTAIASCGPAFLALVAEALVDAGVKHGLTPKLAGLLVHETMAGTAAVLRETADDTRGLRLRVTSPGGITAKGLAELEAGGVRAAMERAVAAASGAGR
jgi:pyrroline-5-carboxylate reductase